MLKIGGTRHGQEPARLDDENFKIVGIMKTLNPGVKYSKNSNIFRL